MDKSCEDLIKEFPEVYKGYKGIQCGTGWYDLLFKLSQIISSELAICSKEDQDLWEVRQVKEKFGGLRFYCRQGNKVIAQAIVRAENKSISICEKCGAKGVLRDGRWLKTLCDAHSEGREEYKFEDADI